MSKMHFRKIGGGRRPRRPRPDGRDASAAFPAFFPPRWRSRDTSRLRLMFVSCKHAEVFTPALYIIESMHYFHNKYKMTRNSTDLYE